MRPLRKDEDQVENNEHRFYSNTPPELKDHPLFGRGTMGMLTAEAPRYLSATGGNKALSDEMHRMGLKHVPTHGSYGGPEQSFIVHNPTREQMYRLGRKFGQEAVIYSQDGKHEMLYTHGPNAGMAHPSLPSMHFSPNKPKDYYTHLPGYGYVGLHFADKLHDTPIKWTMPLEHQAGPHDMPVAKSERDLVVQFAEDLKALLRRIVQGSDS
jgi:hypothetical protein